MTGTGIGMAGTDILTAATAETEENQTGRGGGAEKEIGEVGAENEKGVEVERGMVTRKANTRMATRNAAIPRVHHPGNLFFCNWLLTTQLKQRKRFFLTRKK